jgi:hypothetical protein
MQNLKSLAESLIHGYANLAIRRRRKATRLVDSRAKNRRSAAFHTNLEFNGTMGVEPDRVGRGSSSGGKNRKRMSVSVVDRTSSYSFF